MNEGFLARVVTQYDRNSRNTMLGTFAGYNKTLRGQNIFIGSLAGVPNVTGNNKTYIVTRTGRFREDGNSNICDGTGAGSNVTGTHN